ncbi:MAG TPA: hypothetical protein VIG44_05160, partial [Thermomicrobiales bacterium]
VTSALGFLVAPLAFDYVRSFFSPLHDLNFDHVNTLLDEMEGEGNATLAAAGVAPEQITYRRTAEMRYRNQGHEVPVPLPDGPLSAAMLPALEAAFGEVYRCLYGRVAEGVPLEVLNWRIVASGPRPEINLAAEVVGTASAAHAIKGEREIYLPEESGFAPVPVYDRYALAPGAAFAGPAVIEERESTTIIGGGAVRVDTYRNLIVAMKGEAPRD